MVTMAKSFDALTKFMTQMGEDKEEEKKQREKERQEFRAEREQNSKMLSDLVSRLSISGSTVGVSNVGPTIDALESRIVEFVYDEEDCTFESWYSRYQYIFEIEAKNMDEEKKVRIRAREEEVHA